MTAGDTTTLELIRSSISAGGVFGTLIANGVRVCSTVEQAWVENWPFLSCVPAGRYTLKRVQSPRWGDTYALVAPDLDVYAARADAVAAGGVIYDDAEAAGAARERFLDGEIEQPHHARYSCLWHAANWPHQLVGCAAPGEAVRHIVPHGLGVTRSAATLRELHAQGVLRDGATLDIRWATPLRMAGAGEAR